MIHLRVQLPDRPGSLGAVASALGLVGADIAAVEIVGKAEGFAVNDFALDLPTNALPDTLITACASVPDVRVLWVSRTHDHWGLTSDIDALDRMVADPSRALHTLAEACPEVFHCQWACVLDAERRALLATGLAPELGSDALALLAPLDRPHAAELPPEWAPGWRETPVALTPAARGHLLVVGRQGGPEFLPSEVRRLHHLAALA